MRISRRDIVLLPLIAVLTPFTLMQTTEIVLSHLYVKSARHLGSCMDFAHADAGIPNFPNCSTVDKLYETPLVHYSFNECGLRSVAGCEATTPGTYRIAMLGTSVGMGQWVEYDQTLAPQIEHDVANATHKKISVANYSRMEEAPPLMLHQLPEILQKKPSMVLVVVSPYDVKISSARSEDVIHIAQMAKANRYQWWGQYLQIILRENNASAIAQTMLAHMRSRMQQYRMATLVEEFLYSSQSRYLHQYLEGDNAETGYLDEHPTASWEQSYASFSTAVRQMAALTEADHIPLAVALLPTHAQVVMLEDPKLTAQYKEFDPDFVDEKLNAIVEDNGGVFLDIFKDCAARKNLGKQYFFENGHPNGIALTIYAQMIAERLTSGVVPELKVESSANKEQE